MLIPEARHRLVSAAILVILPLLYFYPAVLGQMLLVPGDGWTQNLGVRVVLGQMIAQGQVPLWNPYIFAGLPLAASVYPGAFYPPNWLFAIFSAGVAMNLVVITTYHLALIGTYLYARRIGIDRTGALVAAAAFTFGGFMIEHLGQASRIAAAAWLPWILLAIEQLHQRARWRWVTLGALFVALQFIAGEPQMFVLTGLVSVAYVAYTLLFRNGGETRWRFTWRAAVMALCGVFLAMIQLLPAREMQQQSGRAHLTYEYFASHSLPPRQLFSLLFPYFFGGAAGPPYKVYYWGVFNPGVSFGSIGMIATLLAVVALLGRKRTSLTFFWGGVAFISLLLTLGDHLPFSLNHLLFQIPIYNAFRGSYRNLFEFTFAAAMLAGLGVNYLQQRDWTVVRTTLCFSTSVWALLVIASLIVYRFFAHHFVTTIERPVHANWLSNPDVLFPTICFGLGAVLIWLFAWHRTTLTGALLVVGLMLDVASFGHYFFWSFVPRDLTTRLQDAPTVQAIKAREANLNSFRIASHSIWPYHDTYELLNHPNISMVRGLQSVNGYDVLRPPRLATLLGEMTTEGVIQQANVFSFQHRGLDLLNVKYLLHERPNPIHWTRGFVIDGIRFIETPTEIKLTKGRRLAMSAGPSTATDIALCSTMGSSVQLADNTPIARLKLYTKDEKVIEREVLIGRDTAEWAYDRPDVKAQIKHRLPRIAESWANEGFQGHRYFARFSFDRAEIEHVEIEYLAKEAELLILRATLYDDVAKTSVALDGVNLQPARWRKLGSFNQVDLYENLHLLPRAWLVSKLEVRPSIEVKEILTSGVFNDGAAFDPLEVGLFELEDFGGRQFTLPKIGDLTNPEVKVQAYRPQRIELETNNAQDSFLVLSEVYSRGWEARIDNQKTGIYRTNFLLRGIAVPPGKHLIEFVYRPSTFRAGLIWAGIGLFILLAGAIVERKIWPHKQEEEPLPKVETEPEHELSTPFLPAISLSPLFARLRSYWAESSPKRLQLLLLGALLLYGAILISRTSFSVSGSDSTGYANLAYSLLHGPIVQPISLLKELGLPPSYALAFTPLAYLEVPGEEKMTPFYPVGMPLHMAFFSLFSGWQFGPYLVTPVFAALSIWLLYLLALEFGLTRSYAIAGAAMLAFCPPFVFQTIQPMSDVVATFWALAAILAALHSQKKDTWSLLAGAAFGFAFLVRPTNILVLVPLAFSLRLTWRSLFFFGLGGSPLALLFFGYNAVAFAHPFHTGYGSIGLQGALMLTGLMARVTHYSYWLSLAMSPLILLGWFTTPWQRQLPWRRRALLLSWFAAFFVFYSFYSIYAEWWYTRFLLPAIPALILALMIACQSLAGWMVKKFSTTAIRPQFPQGVLALVLCLVLGFEQYLLWRVDVFNYGGGQSAHRASCRWANQLLPQQALVIAMEMSGTLKFYTDRPSVRWDLPSAEQLQEITSRATRQGRPLYAFLMAQEVSDAQKKILGDWTKIGEFGPHGAISLWRVEKEH